MYQDFFSLDKEPFHVTPDPAFLFLSRSHWKAYNALAYGIESRKGLVCLTGDAGAGKTTILRSYLGDAGSRRVHAVCFFDPCVSFLHILKGLCRELGMDAHADDVFETVEVLREALLEESREGRTVAVILDEAQDIPRVTLDHLKKLYNLETASDKLLQIVFVGRPEFEKALEGNGLRQLGRRIAVRARISPLDKKESEDYISHRLARAALKNESVFTKGALNKIIRHSDGNPRVLNILCDNALMAGFEMRMKPVPAKIVKEVIACREKEKRPFSLKRAFSPILPLFIKG